MPVLMSEPPIAGRNLVAAEFGPHGVIDQRGQIVRDLLDRRAILASCCFP